MVAVLGAVIESNRMPVAPSVVSMMELPVTLTEDDGPTENRNPVPSVAPNWTSLEATFNWAAPTVMTCRAVSAAPFAGEDVVGVGHRRKAGRRAVVDEDARVRAAGDQERVLTDRRRQVSGPVHVDPVGSGQRVPEIVALGNDVDRRPFAAPQRLDEHVVAAGRRQGAGDDAIGVRVDRVDLRPDIRWPRWRRRSNW